MVGRRAAREPLAGRPPPFAQNHPPLLNPLLGIPPAVHLQSYLVATDVEGLSVLLRKQTVFNCWDSMRDTVIQSEIGTSNAIVEAGYAFDCLMMRYQVGG